MDKLITTMYGDGEEEERLDCEARHREIVRQQCKFCTGSQHFLCGALREERSDELHYRKEMSQGGPVGLQPLI
jgi:hypothetical protein